MLSALSVDEARAVAARACSLAQEFEADAFNLIVPRLNDRSQSPTLASTMHEELRQKWDYLARDRSELEPICLRAH